MTELPVEYLYILSIVLFILSLRWMSEVKTSRLGNWSATAGMAIAILSTLAAFQIQRTDLLVGATLVGTVLGTPIALKVPMTAVPQRTAMSHAFGSLAVALVGAAEYYQDLPDIDLFTVSVLSAEMILGFLTFTGSCVAFAKLQGLIPGRPFVYRGRNLVSLSTLGAAVALGVYLALNPTQEFVLPIMAGLALLFGLLLVLAIGGADMPTVIAILNSYAGISAAALGFVLDNKVLIVAGALDGSSGFILAVIMSSAMNRSFANVLFGGVGSRITAGSTSTAQAARSVQAYTPEDVATVLEDARSVIVVPGYGMAVAQAQHVVKELADVLQRRGIDVKYAIHPVAGRMPGHMNVVLADAQVPYEELWEMDRINPLFPETDVAIVVGANDVTNPAARTKADSPLYGMPILDVDKAKTVVFIKRSTRPGFSGVDNELFYLPNTMMVFGDAKEMLTELVASLKRRGGSRQKG
ncbi:MAG: NAD(P)(+) transhydrogenase (Re/Si-specific) subunit beta [Thaumarchaeota archaeon]|nr:MAG: NAD(P)(+) transhydrogenase (Re/Si-specific) subunit beta [Nitrososphaerota archaeon]